MICIFGIRELKSHAEEWWCREDFDRFLDLQNREIQRLKENGQLSWYLR